MAIIDVTWNFAPIINVIFLGINWRGGKTWKQMEDKIMYIQPSIYITKLIGCKSDPRTAALENLTDLHWPRQAPDHHPMTGTSFSDQWSVTNLCSMHDVILCGKFIPLILIFPIEEKDDHQQQNKSWNFTISQNSSCKQLNKFIPDGDDIRGGDQP